MAIVIAEIMACEDCLLLVANGELPENRPTLGKEIDIYLDLQGTQHLICGDSNASDEFSWHACECCGSQLGGARHQLAILER